MDDSLVLMDAQRIHRSAKRMGYEIIEQNNSNYPILLFGIDHRGYAVAQLLEQVLTKIFEGTVRSIQYPLENETNQDALNNLGAEEVENSFPIVVDDVIFSGETMFRALKNISDKLKPEEIHTAVLVDRGHRRFPIQAEFYGMKLPTKLNEHVSVIVEKMQIKEVNLQKK